MSDRHGAGGRARWLDPLLRVAARLYGVGASLHRAMYEKGFRARRELPCVVVSIGNLSVGGSAKTPLVVETASRLKAQGFRVAVASRGYGRRADRPVEVVSDGRHVRTDSHRAGDEPWFLAGRLPGIPVLVGRDRGTVGLRAVSLFGTELLILDDGFQHHRLSREIDLIAIDSSVGLGGGQLLPAGPLRESVSVLSAADAFVIVDGDLTAEDAKTLQRLAPGAPHFSAARSPRSLFRLGERADLPLSSLAGAEVGLLSGIARPAGFKSTVESLGANVVATRTFADHHRYTEKDVATLGREAPRWLTTEKDAMKLQPDWFGDVEVWVVGIDLRFADSDGFEVFLKQAVAGAVARKRSRPDTAARVA